MQAMSDERDQQRRIVEARLRLRERFLAKMRETPAVADAQPAGSGPPNRHGMPQVPIGQTPTAPNKWPVLDLGIQPIVPLDKWLLKVDGECRNPLMLDWPAFQALEQVDDVSDFHCVTGWSRLDIPWRGVRLATIIAMAEPVENASHIMCHGSDGYETNLPFVEALKDEVLLAHGVGVGPLPAQRGG